MTTAPRARTAAMTSPRRSWWTPSGSEPLSTTIADLDTRSVELVEARCQLVRHEHRAREDEAVVLPGRRLPDGEALTGHAGHGDGVDGNTFPQEHVAQQVAAAAPCGEERDGLAAEAVDRSRDVDPATARRQLGRRAVQLPFLLDEGGRRPDVKSRVQRHGDDRHGVPGGRSGWELSWSTTSCSTPSSRRQTAPSRGQGPGNLDRRQRATSTQPWNCWMTSWATLPSKSAFASVRPRLPITMVSAFRS